MISWRTARIFLLYLASLAVFVVMLAGVSDVKLSSMVVLVSRPEVQPTSQSSPGKPALRPLVNPVLMIPKDAPAIFEGA